MVARTNESKEVPWPEVGRVTVELRQNLRNRSLPRAHYGPMQWFELNAGDEIEHRGVLEVPEYFTAPSPALKLQIFAGRGGTFGVWLLADGTLLTLVNAARA